MKSVHDSGNGISIRKMSEINRCREGSMHLRPRAVDANDAAGEQTVRIHVLNIGDIPPLFMHRREDMGG